MFKHKLFALVYASALGISACAHDAWQPPASGHPADPAAQAGGVTPITSLERYRASQAETDPHMNSGMERDDEADQDGPAAHEHGDHMEESQ
jgi:hypothetical protein